MAPIAAAGAWNMGQWDAMQQYVAAIEPRRAPSTSATAFLRAVLDVHNRDFRAARGGLHFESPHTATLRILIKEKAKGSSVVLRNS